EEDLEDLLACRLEVRQQAELLEDARIEVLRLVDQQGDVAAGAGVLDQELVQTVEAAELARRLGRDAELDQDVLEDLVEADRRVHQEDRADARIEGVEQVAEEGGLPGAGLADERQEALARLDAVAGYVLLAEQVELRLADEGRGRTAAAGRIADAAHDGSGDAAVLLHDETGRGGDLVGERDDGVVQRPAGQVLAPAQVEERVHA